jgi:hypothetical protein
LVSEFSFKIISSNTHVRDALVVYTCNGFLDENETKLIFSRKTKRRLLGARSEPVHSTSRSVSTRGAKVRSKEDLSREGGSGNQVCLVSCLPCKREELRQTILWRVKEELEHKIPTLYSYTCCTIPEKCSFVVDLMFEKLMHAHLVMGANDFR